MVCFRVLRLWLVAAGINNEVIPFTGICRKLVPTEPEAVEKVKLCTLIVSFTRGHVGATHDELLVVLVKVYTHDFKQAVSACVRA